MYTHGAHSRRFRATWIRAIAAFFAPEPGGDGRRQLEHQDEAGRSSGSRWAAIAASTSNPAWPPPGEQNIHGSILVHGAQLGGCKRNAE